MTQPSRILVAMVFSMFFGYMPWYGFSAVSSHLVREFGLSPQQTGAILSAFQLGYVATVIISGLLADRFGNKRVLVWATLATGVFSTLFPLLSTGFKSILVLRLATGLSAGAIYAPGMALLAAWFPSQRRGMAIGAYTAALTASYAGGYLVAAPVAAAFSWRLGILSISVPVFAAAFILCRYVSEAPAVPIVPTETPGECGQGRSAWFPRGFKAPLLLTLGYFGHMWELYAFWGWIGPFLVACALQSGWTAPRAESFSGIASAGIILSGSLAVAVIGILSDRIGRRQTILMAGLASASAEFFFGFLHGAPLTATLGAGSWIGFWCVADSAVYKAGLSETVSPACRGTALGIQSAIGYLATVVSPLFFGWILGTDALRLGETARWGMAFSLLGAGALLAPAAMLLFPKGEDACSRRAFRCSSNRN